MAEEVQNENCKLRSAVQRVCLGAAQYLENLSMDKKAKKRVEVLRKKVATLQQQLAGAKQQPDDPEEPARLQAEIDKVKAEIAELKAS